MKCGDAVGRREGLFVWLCVGWEKEERLTDTSRTAPSQTKPLFFFPSRTAPSQNKNKAAFDFENKFFRFQNKFTFDSPKIDEEGFFFDGKKAFFLTKEALIKILVKVKIKGKVFVCFFLITLTLILTLTVRVMIKEQA